MIEDNGAKTATTRKCGTEKGVDVESRIHENAVERIESSAETMDLKQAFLMGTG